MQAGNLFDVFVGLVLVVIAGGIYKRTRSQRILVLSIILALIGLYLILVGVGLLAPLM